MFGAKQPEDVGQTGALTVGKAHRLVKSLGLGWRDILQAKSDPPDASWLSLAQFVRGSSAATTQERFFSDLIKSRYGLGISARQQEILEEIAMKYGRAA